MLGTHLPLALGGSLSTLVMQDTVRILEQVGSTHPEVVWVLSRARIASVMGTQGVLVVMLALTIPMKDYMETMMAYME
jgi:hypothetical protein